jgi:hypothetical protein
MPEFPPAFLAVARALAVDAWAVEAVQALEAADVPAILLKGPSLARWLYDGRAPRTYADADLLVPLRRREVARDVLRSLGYREGVSPAPPPGTIEHAAPWLRRADSAIIDLHHTISGASTEPEHVWAALDPHTEALVVNGHRLRVLDVPGRALTVALHAAQHGPHVPRPLEDLRRALEVADESVWLQAAALARTLGATAQLGTGLRLLPEGEQIADRLGLSRDAALAAEPTALGFQRLATAQGAVAKLGVLASEIVPSPHFLRWWRPWTRHGRVALAAGYAYRIGWLVAHAPAGWHAWRSARRRT